MMKSLVVKNGRDQQAASFVNCIFEKQLCLTRDMSGGILSPNEWPSRRPRVSLLECLEIFSDFSRGASARTEGSEVHFASHAPDRIMSVDCEAIIRLG